MNWHMVFAALVAVVYAEAAAVSLKNGETHSAFRELIISVLYAAFSYYSFLADRV